MRQWNGHFGKQDPVCWPQLFVDDARFRWLCAVRRDPYNVLDADHIIWTALTLDDITPYSRAGVFGIVSAEFRKRLGLVIKVQRERAEEFLKQNGHIYQFRSLLSQMVDAFERLTLPSTSPDLIRQVACTQRFYLYVDAWLEFHTHLFPTYAFHDPTPQQRTVSTAEPVRVDIMGALTTSFEVAQKLFRAQVPVWLAREPDKFTSEDAVVKIVTSPVSPSHLRDNHGIFPPAVLASEFAGMRHLSAIMCYASQYLDVEVTPRPKDISSDKIYEKSSAHAPDQEKSSKKAKKKGGKGKPSAVSKASNAPRKWRRVAWDTFTHHFSSSGEARREGVAKRRE